MDAKQMIEQLLDDGHVWVARCEEEYDPRTARTYAIRAIGYFEAATTLLNAFAEWHNNMVELAVFVDAHRFIRKYR